MERQPRYTYGDRIRRTSGGPVLTVSDIGPTAYYFDDGTFALIDDQDCYTLVEKASGYFRVSTTLDGLPLDDYLHHGYEHRQDFAAALRRLLDYWGGRTGQRIQDRNKFLLLRFPDTPGGLPDEAWLPLYMLTPCAAPQLPHSTPQPDPIEQELDAAFGFD